MPPDLEPRDSRRLIGATDHDEPEIVIALPVEEEPALVQAEVVDDLARLERRSRNRRRAVAILGVVAAVAVLAVVLAVSGAANSVWQPVESGAGEVGDAWDSWTTRLQTIAAEEPSQVLAAAPDPGSASLLAVVADESGAAASVALLSSSPDGDHAVVLFPPSLLATVPGYGDFALAETIRFEDADLTALTVSNLIGVRVDAVAQFDAGDLAAALGGPVVVDLPLPVVFGGDDGGLLADAGQSTMGPELLETVLVTPGEASHIEWLERQGAIWDAVLDAVRQRPGVVDGVVQLAAPATQAEAVITTLAATENRALSAVPLSRVDVGDSERFALPRDEAEAFVAARLDHLLLREGDRPRVEVLNGNGRTQTTRLVAETLVRMGFEVIKTDNADSFDYPESRVISQGRDNRLAGTEVVELLGVGRLELELRRPSGVVDVSIIVGHDIPTGEG